MAMTLSHHHHHHPTLQISTSLMLLLTLCPDLSSSLPRGPISLGRFPSLAHGLQGEVIILNDKQIRIRGFTYDGQGPAVWFMGMKNNTEGIYSADGIAFPNQYGNCRNLQRAYKDEDITITLPQRVRVYDIEAFSVYCYEFCHNFGHLRIPKNLRLPPAPRNTPRLRRCYPRYPLCSKDQSH